MVVPFLPFLFVAVNLYWVYLLYPVQMWTKYDANCWLQLHILWHV